MHVLCCCGNLLSLIDVSPASTHVFHDEASAGPPRVATGPCELQSSAVAGDGVRVPPCCRVWDSSRTCRAFWFDLGTSMFSATDVTCTWTLGFVCVDAEAAEQRGWQVGELGVQCVAWLWHGARLICDARQGTYNVLRGYCTPLARISLYLLCQCAADPPCLPHSLALPCLPSPRPTDQPALVPLLPGLSGAALAGRATGPRYMGLEPGGWGGGGVLQPTALHHCLLQQHPCTVADGAAGQHAVQVRACGPAGMKCSPLIATTHADFICRGGGHNVYALRLVQDSAASVAKSWELFWDQRNQLAGNHSAYWVSL